MPENNSISEREIFQSTLTHHLIRGSSVVIFFALAAAPIGYLIRMIYSRSLSVEMYGLFYSVLAFLMVFTAFNNLGFGYSVSYLVPKFVKKKQYKNAWNSYRYNQIIEVASSLFFSIILCLLAPWLAKHFFKAPEAENLIYIFTLFFVSESFLSSIDRFFTGLQQEKYYSSISFSKLLFTLIYTSIFWFLNYKNVFIYAVAMSLSYCSVAFLYRYFLHKKNKLLITKFSWNKPLFKKMLNYAIPTLLASALATIGSSIDTFFLIGFKNVSEVGIYNIVLPLVMISPMFLSPINSLLLPLISKLEDEDEKIRKLIETLLKIVPFIALYFAIFIFIFSRSVVQTVFGSKWMDISQQPLMIASLGYVLLPFISFLGTFLKGLGLVKEHLKITPFLSIFKIMANLVFIYFFGVMGAIVANISLFVVTGILVNRIISKKITFNYPFLFYVKLAIFGLTFYLVTNYFHINAYGILKLFTAGIIYTLLYVYYGYSIGVIDKESLSLIKNNMKNFL